MHPEIRLTSQRSEADGGGIIMDGRLIGHQSGAGNPAEAECRLVGCKYAKIDNAGRDDQAAGIYIFA